MKLDEIKALINDRFDEFSKKLASTEESLIHLRKNLFKIE